MVPSSETLVSPTMLPPPTIVMTHGAAVNVLNSQLRYCVSDSAPVFRCGWSVVFTPLLDALSTACHAAAGQPFASLATGLADWSVTARESKNALKNCGVCIADDGVSTLPPTRPSEPHVPGGTTVEDSSAART